MPDETPFIPPQPYKPPGPITAKQKRWAVAGVIVLFSVLLLFGTSKPGPLPARPKPPALHRTTLDELNRKSQESPTHTQAPKPSNQPAMMAQPRYATESPAQSIADQIKQRRQELEYKASFEDSMVARPAARELPAAVPVAPSLPLPPQPVPASAPVAAPETHTLPEGTLIDCVLVNGLDGDFAGPVEAQVATNVYEPTTQALLIPQGARVLGETNKVSGFGQQRLAVTFHRLLIGNGPGAYSVSLERVPGLDQQGETALSGKVNGHYASIFGASLAIGVIGGLAQIGNGGNLLSYSPSMQFRNGITESTAQSSEMILNRFLSRNPTIKIPPGKRIQVYIAQDLQLPDYRPVPMMRLEPTAEETMARN